MATLANSNGHINGNVTHMNGYSNMANGTDKSPLPQNAKDVPIAICGMGMRLPGGIRNSADLYSFLINKQDSRSITGSDRYNVEAFYNPHAKHGTIITKHGCFLDDVDLTKFDTSMFSMTPAEVDQLDPNQRLALEVVREALENAGETEWRGKNIGSYVGTFTEDWQDLHSKDTHDFGPYQLIGKLDFAIANRISYEYDLKGPSMTIKSACSSAGLCLHQALQAIRQGEISSAIVAGTNLIMAPGMTVGMSVQLTLSPDGSSKSFDAAADGYARGEGVTALYVKRLENAIKDGNPIRAIIRSSATNADGKTAGLAMPNPLAHEAVIRQTYAAAGLDFSQTAMVEAHGTGTAVGDPLEVEAIANCFGKEGVYLGAIKPNLGHSEGAAAITSIMKAVLSLENKTIIPNIKFKTPNPAIPWESAKLVVPVEPTSWPSNRCERLSVNSYGIGGSNAHFILDSAASFGIAANRRAQGVAQQRKNLLLFSAGHSEALKVLCKNYSEYLENHPSHLEDLAYTLAQRREHLRLRSFCVTDGSVPIEVSPQVKSRDSIQVAFIFTGQGAQWVHMGRQLMRDYPSFLASVKFMDKVLRGLDHCPSWSIEEILLNSEDKAIIGSAEYSQPICTALQIAIVELLEDWGIVPSAVVGHSSGEIAAAYAAGSLTKEEAIITAFYRGYVCKNTQKRGGMAAIGLGVADVTPFLQQGVNIACENSATSVTLSGDVEILENVIRDIKQQNQDTFARRLQVEMAYHSNHMKLVGDEYGGLIGKHLNPKTPRVPFYSSVRAKVLQSFSDFGATYWQENLENPVLFHSAVKALLAGSPNCSVHLEVGPHSALAGPLRQIYKEASSSTQYVATMGRNLDDTVVFLEAVGQLHCIGYKLSFRPEDGHRKVLTDLPTYPWQYDKSYWSESRLMKSWRFRKHLPHDLLGLRTLEGSDLSPTWRNCLRVFDVPWLRDHCVGNDIIFPAAGYIAMAGEAIFQLTDVHEYTVREVTFSQAMVLNAEKPTEIITSLRPQRLTSTLDSNWYEFYITSHDGSAWNKHCSGLVSSGRASAGPSPIFEIHPRKISSSRWYTTMARVGLNYGPRFTGLGNITASVVDKKATADIMDHQEEIESFYPLHPSSLDLVLQTWTVASCKGEYRTFNKLYLPTFIEELYIGNGAGKKICVNTTAVGKYKDTAQGHSYGVSNGELVFFLKGFKGTPLEDAGIEEPPELTALQLQWKPDFEFLHADQLMGPKYDVKEQQALLERLYVLCAVESKKELLGVTASQPHFEKYRTWISEQYERFESPGYPLVEDSRELISMDENSRRNLILDIVEQCKRNGTGPVAIAMWRSYDQLVNVFEGKTDFLDLLLQDGVLPAVYNWMNELWDFTNYFQLLGHAQPQMRILEIGAGTGGLTAKILEHLKSDFGERLYLSYIFTDISSGFFVQAQERFKEYEGMDYKVLDISQDPLEQGFNAGQYDLIIASNVLHATPFLHETLSNVRKLLQPKGRLFLQELSPITRCMGYIMGLFSGWWLGEPDGRFGGPFVSPEIWDEKLRGAGFAGCDSVTYDNERPYHMNANIVAKPAIGFQHPTCVTLLSGSEIHPLAETLEKLLTDAGCTVEHRTWGQEISPEQDLISFVDLDRSLFQNISGPDLEQFLKMVELLQQSIVLWLTPPAQIRPTDPHAAQVLGIARTIRSELAMSFATLELEHTGAEAAGAVFKVFRKTQSCQEDLADLDSDMEYAWADGHIQLSRFHWIPVGNALCDTAPTPDAKGLVIGKRGLLQTLQWTGQQLDEPGADDAQIKMIAVGLNFTDIIIAMGIINSVEALGKGYNAFGLEGTGYITKVGSNVTHVKPGDRVMLIGTNSAGLATEIQRPGEFCVKIPDSLSSEGAASMPAVYVTVLLCFLERTQVKKGDSVLIHSAAGGVGIAAIYVARWIGAEIYATVGTEEKAKFLVDELGVPRDRIFHSRDTSFLDGIMEATNGRGVDYVLNSVSGELLHATWKCVADQGTMIEIGKRDMIGRGKLAMDPFEWNRTFIGVDLSRFTVVNKPAVGRMMRQLLELYENGHVKPIHPITTYDAERIEDAYRYLQKGLHIGKVVIKFPEEDTLPFTPTIPEPSFRGGVSYLLAGGLGGLGKSIATWMASNGAKNLIFISRSAGTSEQDQHFFEELGLMGCSVQCFPGDVADISVVTHAIEEAAFPIAGVMQMAMVLSDVGVMEMDLPTWNTAIRPKVQGTWNLHNLLPNNLDFFVLFSSTCGLLGYYGQANYASANTFLDAFVQYRQKLGLEASVMDIGAVDDVGYVSRTPAAKENMIASSGRLMTEQNFLDCLQLTIARSATKYCPSNPTGPFAGYQNPSQIAQVLECRLPIMDPANGIIWKRDPRMAIYRNIENVATDRVGEAGDALKHFLSSVQAEPSKLDEKGSIEILAREIGNRVCAFLMKAEEDIDLSMTLAAVGVDSLVAIEVRNWWKQNFVIDVSVLELMNGGSIEQLGELAAGRLKAKIVGKEKIEEMR